MQSMGDTVNLIVHNQESKLGIIRQSIDKINFRNNQPASDVRAIISKYCGNFNDSDQNVDWLDEFEKLETKKQALENLNGSLKKNDDEGFSDIEQIRRKYLGTVKERSTEKRQRSLENSGSKSSKKNSSSRSPKKST